MSFKARVCGTAVTVFDKKHKRKKKGPHAGCLRMLAATSPCHERGRAPRFSSFPVFVSSAGPPGELLGVDEDRFMCVCPLPLHMDPSFACIFTLHPQLSWQNIPPPPPSRHPGESQAAQTNETPVGARRRRGGSERFPAALTVAFRGRSFEKEF